MDLNWQSNSETDYDGDGCQDESDEDLDDDNDGAADADDSDDNNIFECSDNDQDGCEDCLTGTYDTSNDGDDSDNDGQCDLGDVDLQLNANANLISFFALPEDNDYSVENIFGSLGDNIVKVLGESQVGLNLDFGWVGSLSDVSSDDGYWVVLNDDQTLQVQGLPTAPVMYGVHEGNNLISYDHSQNQFIDSAFPGDAVSSMSAVYGEGEMAAVIDGEFFGALNTIDAGSGYWLVADAPFVFEYNEPGSDLPRLADEEPPVVQELYYTNTTNQYFYFIEEATIAAKEINHGDWVVAYNNDIVVGARQYKSGGMIDLPIMGYDDSSEQLKVLSAGYCQTGDIPTIKIHRTNGTITDMNVDVKSGSRTFLSSIGGGHAMVTLTDGLELPTEVSLHNAYPNPFNPVTMIEYEIPNEMFVNLSIYDIRGRLVTELVNNMQAAAISTYKVIWNADMQASGVYFVRLTAGDTVKKQKIMLIK